MGRPRNAAEMAFGREMPTAEQARDSKELARERRAALRAVERAVTPLFGAGAITTVRHSSGRRDRTAPPSTGYGSPNQHPTKNVVCITLSPDEKRPAPDVL